ncbi:MAG: methylamine utilization protein MauJ [Armatimonadota bacterium]|nr:methylamine utilization protein MauJ [Armatimonadota bacterium]
MKIGRNEPCPCGSGRKYKHCCYIGNKAPEQHSLNVTLDQKVADDMLTHGYLRKERLVIQPTNSSIPSSVDLERLNGATGEYEVEFTMRSPTALCLTDTIFETRPNIKGDSLLALYPPIQSKDIGSVFVRLDIMLMDGSVKPNNIIYYCYPNEAGSLSHINTTIKAESFENAESVALKHLTAILTQLSFERDVPIDIARIRVEEKSSGTYICEFIHPPYKRSALNNKLEPVVGEVPKLYHPLVLYREALGTASPVYQFLCFFKVIELVRELRRVRNKAAKASGASISFPQERLQEEDWLNKHVPHDLLKQAIGKNYTNICDNILRPIRHGVAHAFLDNEGPAARPAEEMLNLDEVYRHLPLVKYIARQMILNEMGFNT